jgi:hypothetical protein
VLLHAKTAAFAADSGSLGDGIVYVTNSAAGLRAQMTAILSNSTNIKGIVAYESIGYAFPASFNITGFPKSPVSVHLWFPMRIPGNWRKLRCSLSEGTVGVRGRASWAAMLG